jgi:hypothetical protein
VAYQLADRGEPAVNTTSEKILTPDACMEVMEAFWREQVQVATTREGVALTLPLMYPDGWQVTVYLNQLTPGWVRISDHGKTLGTLIEAGMSLEAKHTAALLTERVETFELRSDGAILSKDVPLPLQGIDVQLFAEALISIAHLIYRYEPVSLLENPADKAVRRVFENRKVQPRRNAELKGHLLQATRVDYLVEAKSPLAVQVVNRRENLLDYMEKWAFRWSDLQKQNDRLLAGMVYNPENQDWDATSLRIGNEVCDVFCRYDELEPLNRILDRVGV